MTLLTSTSTRTNARPWIRSSTSNISDACKPFGNPFDLSLPRGGPPHLIAPLRTQKSTRMSGTFRHLRQIRPRTQPRPDSILPGAGTSAPGIFNLPASHGCFTTSSPATHATNVVWKVDAAHADKTESLVCMSTDTGA
jgi:hypothetical protein